MSENLSKQSLIKEVQLFASQQGWILDQQVTLLAVSGGVDSMVMTAVFQNLEWPFAIAHCNFRLRSEASEQDEVLVREWAKQLGVPVYVQHWNTASIANERGQSIQVCARELRYQWLMELRKEEGFAYIATGHHLDDNVETIVGHFIRGSGIRGMRGIPVQRGGVIRPLLSVSRETIQSYAQIEKIPWREDASNKKTDYTRNFIRLKLLPLIQQVNPGFKGRVVQQVPLWRAQEAMMDTAAAEWKKELCKNNPQKGWVEIELAAMEDFSAFAIALLYEWLRPFGFTATQVENLWESRHRTGGQWESDTHELLVDRGRALLQVIRPTSLPSYTIEGLHDSPLLFSEGRLYFQASPVKKVFSKDLQCILVDAAKLRFPLTLRLWEPGDRFQPLGMGGKHKKVKKELTDQGLAAFQKRNTYVLCNNDGCIIWLLGVRPDHRFCLQESTQEACEIRWEPKRESAEI